MVSFVQQTIVFLAGVSLAVSVPIFGLHGNEAQDSTNRRGLIDAESEDIKHAVNAMIQLSNDQKVKLQEPLEELAKNFDGTLFGSLFSYIKTLLQNPEPSAQESDLDIFKRPVTPESFLSTLQNLSNDVIERSKPQFETIKKILRDSPFEKLFDEILATLNAGQILFQNPQMGDIGNKIIENLANQVPEANSSQLTQNPLGTATSMANVVKNVTPGSVKRTLNPAEIPNVGDFFKVNQSGGFERINSFQQRMKKLPSGFPFSTSGRSGTMSV